MTSKKGCHSLTICQRVTNLENADDVVTEIEQFHFKNGYPSERVVRILGLSKKYTMTVPPDVLFNEVTGSSDDPLYDVIMQRLHPSNQNKFSNEQGDQFGTFCTKFAEFGIFLESVWHGKLWSS